MHREKRRVTLSIFIVMRQHEALITKKIRRKITITKAVSTIEEGKYAETNELNSLYASLN